MVGTMAKIAVTNPRLFTYFVMGELDVSTIVEGAQEAEQSSSLAPVESKVNELGGGFYRIMFMAGVFLIILGLGVAALKLFFSDSQTRKDAKSDIVWKVLAGIFFFAGIMLVILFSNIGTNLFAAGD